MKKILFLTPTLGGGGAERIIVYLSNYLSDNASNDVYIYTLKSDGNTYAKQCCNEVKIKSLAYRGRVRYSFFRILSSVLKLKPHICFVGESDLNLIVALLLPVFHLFGIRCIVRETNVKSSRFPDKPWYLLMLYRVFYNMYDRIVVQSSDMMIDLIDNWSISDNKVVLINNPVDVIGIQEKSEGQAECSLQKGEFQFVAVGRLFDQKGYDILLERLKGLPEDIKISVTIIGDGPLKELLNNLILAFGLKDRVKLAGYCSNPYAIIRTADAIVLSSRYEGFPNVLLEAGVLGKPIFANQCPGGINEIVIEGENGYTCDFCDQDDFNLNLVKFLNTKFDEGDIKRLTIERYSFDVILPKYNSVFLSV